jgi:hyaluronoglucosaminidase
VDKVRSRPARPIRRALLSLSALSTLVAITSLLQASPGLPGLPNLHAGAATHRVASPGDIAWVATDASVTEPGSAITPVDLSSRTPEAKVHVGSLPAAASLPSAVTFTKGNAALLVVTRGDDMLNEIEPSTHRVEHKVTVGLEPDAVAVAPGGAGGKGIALVANSGDNTVTPVDLGTWKAGKPIPVGTEPVAVAVASGTAFVADFGSNQVPPIDLATMQAGPPIAVGQGPETLAVAVAVAGPTGPTASAEVLVGNFGDDSLTPIDAATLMPGPAVALPVNPTDIVVTTSGTTAYIAGGSSVVPLTVSGLAVGTPIALRGVAQALALAPGDGTAWVALQTGSLVPVSLPSGTVGHAIHLGGHPSAIAIAS